VDHESRKAELLARWVALRERITESARRMQDVNNRMPDGLTFDCGVYRVWLDCLKKVAAAIEADDLEGALYWSGRAMLSQWDVSDMMTTAERNVRSLPGGEHLI
jgi:hypothetical protein